MDAAEATLRLLAAWRERRHPELAAAVARAGTLAAAVAPEELEPSHPGWVSRRTERPMVEWLQFLLPLAEALLPACPDPRVGAWAAARLARGGLNRRGEELFLELVERCAAADLLEPLARASVKRPRAPRLDALRERLRALEAPALTDEDRALVEACDAALARQRAYDPALGLLRALDHPDDVEALSVLADALVERGSPRGEHMQLQLLHARGGGDAATRKAEASLFRAHWRAWFPELAAALAPSTTTCRNGLLYRVGLHGEGGGDLRAIVEQPSLRTAREVVVHGSSSELLQVLPPWIEAVWGLDLLFAPLGHRPTWRRVGFKSTRERDLRQVLAACPRLEVLALDHVDDVRELLAAKVAVKDVTLCLGAAPAAVDASTRARLAGKGFTSLRFGPRGLAAWDAPTEVV